jgi:hypothetical protein
VQKVIDSIRRSLGPVVAALAALVCGLLVLSPAVASGAGSGQQVTVCDYDHLVAAIDAAGGSTVTAGKLRAEAYAATRYYTLKYQAQDHAGNTAYCTPKDNVPPG